MRGVSSIYQDLLIHTLAFSASLTYDRWSNYLSGRLVVVSASGSFSLIESLELSQDMGRWYAPIW